MPLFTIILLSEWSDRLGRRKRFILFALTGRLLFSIMMAIVSMECCVQFGSLFSLTYAVILPGELFGGQLFVMSMCFSHLTDITTNDQRTTRMIIANAVVFSAMPIGLLLGIYVYDTFFGLSYAAIFILSALLVGLAIIWTLFRVSDHAGNYVVNKTSTHENGDVAMSSRRVHRKARCIILFVMIFICELEHNEKRYSYLYKQLVFGWTYRDVSFFRSYQTGLLALVMIIIPAMMPTIRDRHRETLLMILSLVSRMLAKLIYFYAHYGRLFYLGALIGAGEQLIEAILPSLLSKESKVQNTARMFLLVFLCHNFGHAAGSIAYSKIYALCIDVMPGAFFIFTVATQWLLLLLVGVLAKLQN